MPHYVFLCRDCEKKFEQTIHISELDKTPVKCPHCGSEKPSNRRRRSPRSRLKRADLFLLVVADFVDNDVHLGTQHVTGLIGLAH